MGKIPAGKPAAKKKENRGGARSRSGPLPAPVKATLAEIERATRERLIDWLPQLFDNVKRLADGIKMQDVADDGMVDYYTTPPDFKANQYLIDRLLGKPTERKEIAGADGKPLASSVVVYLPDNLRNTKLGD